MYKFQLELLTNIQEMKEHSDSEIHLGTTQNVVSCGVGSHVVESGVATNQLLSHSCSHLHHHGPNIKATVDKLIIKTKYIILRPFGVNKHF